MIELCFYVNNGNKIIIQPSFINKNNTIILFDFQKINKRNEMSKFYIGSTIDIIKENNRLIEFPKNVIVENIYDDDGDDDYIMIDGWFLIKSQQKYFKYIFELDKVDKLPIRLILEFFGDYSNVKFHIPSLLNILKKMELKNENDQIDVASKRKTCMPSLYGFIHVQKIDICKNGEINNRYKLTGVGIDVITSYLIETHKLFTQYNNDVFLFCSSFTSCIWPPFEMSKTSEIKRNSYNAAIKFTRSRKTILMEKDYWCFVINDNNDHWVFVIIYKPFDSNEKSPLMFISDSLYSNFNDTGEESDDEDEDDDDEEEDNYNKRITRLYVSICILICFTQSDCKLKDITEIPMYMKDRGFANLKCYLQNDGVSCGYHALLNLSTFITSPLSRSNTVNSQSLYFSAPSSSSYSSDHLPHEITFLFNNIIMQKYKEINKL